MATNKAPFAKVGAFIFVLTYDFVERHLHNLNCYMVYISFVEKVGVEPTTPRASAVCSPVELFLLVGILVYLGPVDDRFKRDGSSPLPSVAWQTRTADLPVNSRALYPSAKATCAPYGNRTRSNWFLRSFTSSGRFHESQSFFHQTQGAMG